MAKRLIFGTDVIQLTESLNVAGDKNIEIKADGKKYYATLWEKGKSVVNAISIGLVKIGTNKYGILTSPVRGQQESHEFFLVLLVAKRKNVKHYFAKRELRSVSWHLCW